MLAADGFTAHVVARLLDFVGDRAPWQRQLWTVGTVLRLAEGEEAVRLSGTATGLVEASVKQALASARELARDDPGIGSQTERGRVAGLLSVAIEPGSEEHHRLAEITASARAGYLDRWAAALADAPPRIELTARLIAAHLLDGGSSAGHLYRWLDRLQQDEATTYTFTDIVEMAKEQETEREIAVMVPFHAIPRFGQMPGDWKNSQEVREWLEQQLPELPADIEGQALNDIIGGIVTTYRVRDAGAAAAAAADMIETYRARVDIGSKRTGFEPAGVAFVAGAQWPLPLRSRRGVNIRALERESELFAPARGAAIDSAFELISLLDRGSPAAAIAGGWASVESLLKAPGDGGAHKVAPRLAALVACSFIRAELTTLAWRHIRRKGKDEAAKALAHELKSLDGNEDRAARVAELLLAGGTLGLPDSSDMAAEQRVLKLLQAPKSGLTDILSLVEDPLARFYRQRNQVLHGGRTEAVALRASLRTATPLIGAALDRIAHAWFVNNVEPLRLATIARLRLERVESPDAAPLTAMLE